MAVVGCVLLFGVAAAAASWKQVQTRVISAGFWFDDVSYRETDAITRRLGGPLTAQDLRTVSAVAMDEINQAFDGLRITFSDSHTAPYRVRVVHELRYPNFPRMAGPAGESRGIRGLGGQGTLNFKVLTVNAVRHAPPDADRSAIVIALGRGIGRAAVHEFAHQFLGTVDLHARADINSYEYRSADRREQYYGAMSWGAAGSLVQKRIGYRPIVELSARNQGPTATPTYMPAVAASIR